MIEVAQCNASEMSVHVAPGLVQLALESDAMQPVRSDERARRGISFEAYPETYAPSRQSLHVSE